MTVRALLEYGIWGDSDYHYITSFEATFKRDSNATFWRERFVREMSGIGLKIKYIKIIKEEYVRD